MISKRKVVNYFYIFFFVSICAALIYKCRFGYGANDEAFYLTMPYRFVQGDKLLVNDWGGAQVSGFLMIPLVRMYLAIFGNTDGILLAFRYIFVIVWATGSVVIFVCLRKYTDIGAAAASLAFLIYTPGCVSALCYNSMGLLFLELAAVFFFTMENDWLWFVSGSFYACAVLCCPYLASLLIFYAVLFLIFRSKYQKKSIAKRVLLFLSGIALMAIIFLAYCFSRSTLQEVVAAFPHHFEQDDHQYSILFKIQTLFNRVFYCDPTTPWIYLGFGVLFFFGIIIRNRKFKITIAILTLVLAVYYMKDTVGYPQINYSMFPLNPAAFIIFHLFPQEKIKPLFQGVWLTGMLYAICLHFASNTFVLAITSASTVATVASIVIIISAAEEILKDKEIGKTIKILLPAVLALTLTIQLSCEMYHRMRDIFGYTTTISDQTVPIEMGPQKGLRATEEIVKSYEGFFNDFSLIEENGQRILFVSKMTWPYLCKPWRMGSYSAWLDGDVTESTMKRLDNFYVLNPDLQPEVIYIERQYSELADHFIGEYHFSEIQPKNGILLEKR